MKFSLIFLMLLIPSQIFAEAKPYFSVGAGLAIPNNFEETGVTVGLNTGFKATAAVGVEVNNFRTEIEYSYRETGLDYVEVSGIKVDIGGNANVNSLMGNFYYSFLGGGILSPYAGVGFGMAWEELSIDEVVGIDIPEERGEEEGFAYQLMVGVTAKIIDRLSSDIEYRYFEANYTETHEIGVNLRLGF